MARELIVPVVEHDLVEDLEYDVNAVALLQQLKGDWEIEHIVVRGKNVQRLVQERFRIEDNLLQMDYPIEKIGHIPSEHRATFEQPWKAVGFNPQLEAMEFQKMIVAATNDWQPVLCRRYLTFQDGKLLMVCADNPRLLPQTLDAADDNYVFSCRKTTTRNR